MSCFKIIFILTNFFLFITLTVAKAKEPKQVTVAKVDNHIITAKRDIRIDAERINMG